MTDHGDVSWLLRFVAAIAAALVLAGFGLGMLTGWVVSSHTHWFSDDPCGLVSKLDAAIERVGQCEESENG